MKVLQSYFFKIRAFFRLVQFFVFESKKLKNAQCLFIFPFYHTGGAEKVHLNILKALQDSKKYALFTGQSSSSHYKKQFFKEANCCDIYDLLQRNYFIRNLFIKIVTKNINKSETVLTVFGSNNYFFYELLPNLNSNIQKIDLIHAFSRPDYGIEIASLPFVSYLDQRVVINQKTLIDFKELYQHNNLNNYLEKIIKIENGISINNEFSKKSNKKFKVLFVGRWSKEKRPELFLEIAKNVISKTQGIQFVMVGSGMMPHIKEIEEAGVVFKGEIQDENTLNQIYDAANVILITSYREGFPVVVMEAMAKGVVPIVTNVGGLSEHIIHGNNGFLIENFEQESIIVSEFIEKIIEMYENSNYYNLMSKNGFDFAQYNFSLVNFNLNYNKLFNYFNKYK